MNLRPAEAECSKPETRQTVRNHQYLREKRPGAIQKTFPQIRYRIAIRVAVTATGRTESAAPLLNLRKRFNPTGC